MNAQMREAPIGKEPDLARAAPNLDGLSKTAREVIEIEARAIAGLVDRIGDEFRRACVLMLECTGRVVVTGMGKSGHVGR